MEGSRRPAKLRATRFSSSAGPARVGIDRHLTMISESSPTSDLFPASKTLQLKCLGIKREPEDSSSKNDPFFFTPELANPC